MPTQVMYGDDSVHRLHDVPVLKDADRVALFMGSSSGKKKPFHDDVMKELEGKDVRVIEVTGQPSPLDLQREVDAMRAQMCNCVVAVGGGSPLDLAKAVAFCVNQAEDTTSILNAFPSQPQPSVPVVAIPTTAGTGSEVTPFTVFWDEENKKKYSLAHTMLYPTVAIVDPLLTYSMPPYVTATTGMDAFTQACEAYWNVNANPMSDDYALSAVGHIIDMLPRAVSNGEDAEARSAMMLGSLQAGLAFSNTRTTACHSISYPMSLHFGVVHGQAVGITLPEVIRLNAETLPDRVDAFCEALGVSTIQEAVDRIRTMMKNSQLETRLSAFGIDEQGIELIVRDGFTPERMGNNPYKFDAESLTAMLERIL